MNIIGSWTWKGLGDALFSPKATGIESKINEVKQRLPIPVFWLLGKTQSGKTSLIRALTGSDAAERVFADKDTVGYARQRRHSLRARWFAPL